jgi:hypothetical protein
MIDEKTARALAGLGYAAFTALQKGDTEWASWLIGNQTRHLLLGVDIESPYDQSQMERLVEEGLKFIVKRPLPLGEE